MIIMKNCHHRVVNLSLLSNVRSGILIFNNQTFLLNWSFIVSKVLHHRTANIIVFQKYARYDILFYIWCHYWPRRKVKHDVIRKSLSIFKEKPVLYFNTFYLIRSRHLMVIYNKINTYDASMCSCMVQWSPV